MAEDGKEVKTLPFDGVDIDSWSTKMEHFIGAKDYACYEILYTENGTRFNSYM